jgi:type VI secretion system protein ImpA
MPLALDELLANIRPDNPAGVALRTDPDFIAFWDRLEAKPRGMFEAGGTASSPPSYADQVAFATEALIGKGKDLAAAMLLARALLKTEGLPGLADALALIGSLLEKRWHDLHPLLDTMAEQPLAQARKRLNELKRLVGPSWLLNSIDQIELGTHPELGPVTMHQFRQNGELNKEQLAAALASAQPQDRSGLLAAARLASEHVAAIGGVLEQKLGSGALDLAPLATRLQLLVSFLGDTASAPVASPSDGREQAADVTSEAVSPATSSSRVAAPAATSLPGRLESPAEVEAALRLAIDYYVRREPTHPLRFHLERALRLVHKDLFEVLKDLAPAAVEAIAKIGGPGGKS